MKFIRLYIVELLMRLQLWIVPSDTPEAEDLAKGHIKYCQGVIKRNQRHIANLPLQMRSEIDKIRRVTEI